MPNTTRIIISFRDKTVVLSYLSQLRETINNPVRHITRFPIHPLKVEGYYSEGRAFQHHRVMHGSGKRADVTTNRLCVDTGSYELFLASFGKDGIRGAFHKNDCERVGKIHKDYKTYDDAHKFELDVDENNAMECIILCIEWYMNTYFTKTVMIKSVEFSNHTTKNTTILDKVL